MSDILSTCQSLPSRRIQPGDILIEEGKTNEHLFILESGSVEILKQDVRINTVSSQGSMFGEVSLLLGSTPMATVKAVEPCVFRVAENGLEFLCSHPVVHLELSRLIAKRLNGVTTYLVDLKHQFEDSGDHLGMVDEVLESILNNPK